MLSIVNWLSNNTGFNWLATKTDLFSAMIIYIFGGIALVAAIGLLLFRKPFLEFLKAWYGNFTAEELKKYIFLGIIFSIIIGTYWTLRPLKDAIFGNMVLPKNGGKGIFAFAKIFSMFLLIPVVGAYGKLVDKFKKSKYQLLYILGLGYAISLAFWALYFWSPWGLQPTIEPSAWRIPAWFWYVFVESFGSLVVALFWAFVVDISTSESAKKGFALIVMIGQIGGIVMPKYLTKIPAKLGTNDYPVVLLCGLFVLLVVGLIKQFVSTLPKAELTCKGEEQVKHEEEPGFLDGLKLMVSHKYLLGIFAVLSFFELITTIIDFNFKTMVIDAYGKGAAGFLGEYASWVNFISFVFLLLGINNISRWLGLRVALALVPAAMAVSVFMFWANPGVTVLFWIMVASKAINYALNGPALKQLYVPTTDDVKYKSQAWIETFGSRGAKAASSGINGAQNLLGFATYLVVATVFSFSLIVAWFAIALFLGSTYAKAIKDKKVVC